MTDGHDEGGGKRGNLPIYLLGLVIFFFIIIAMVKVYRGEGVMYTAPDPPQLEPSHMQEEW